MHWLTWRQGVSCRCSCLGLTAQSAQDFLFLVSWRTLLLVGCVGQSLVCLFISNDQWLGQVCVNMEGQLPVITDHTHTSLCIYKPVIYCIYCNFAPARRHIHCTKHVQVLVEMCIKWRTNCKNRPQTSSPYMYLSIKFTFLKISVVHRSHCSSANKEKHGGSCKEKQKKLKQLTLISFNKLKSINWILFLQNRLQYFNIL